MRTSIGLLVLLWCAVITCDVQPPFFSPISLPLEQGHDGRYYTYLVVGNPGHTLKFLLDFSANHTEINTSLHTFSQTYAVYGDSEWGSELFYFRQYKLRMPVKYGVATTTAYQGVLGLGQFSWLWRRWVEYTVVPSELTLGSYTGYSKDDVTFYAPMLSYSQPVAYIDSTPYTIQWHGTDPNTYLPATLYAQEDISLTLDGHCSPAYEKCGVSFGLFGQCYSSWPLHWSTPDFQILDPITNFHYKALHRGHTPHTISLGTVATRNLFFYHNWFHNVFAVQLSYRYGQQVSFNLFASLLLSITLFLWLSMVFVHKITSERTHILLIGVQLYGITFAIATWFTNIVGLHNTRLFMHHFHSSGLWLQIVLGILLILDAIVTCAFIFRTFRWLPKPWSVNRKDYENMWYVIRLGQTLPLQRLFFENAVFLALWIAVLQTNSAIWDFMLTLAVITIYALLVSVLTLDAWLYHGFGGTFLLCLIYLVATYTFLIAFNLTTAVHVLWNHHAASPAFIAFYVFAAVVVPAMYIFMKKHVHLLVTSSS